MGSFRVAGRWAARTFALAFVAGALALNGCGLTDPEGRAVAVLILAPDLIHLDAIGAEIPITVIARDEGGGSVGSVPMEWSSENERVVSVSEGGRVRAVAPGEAMVRVRSGRAEARARVRVEPNPAQMELAGGEGQEAPAGSVLPQRMRVRVLDRLGTPVAGAAVEVEPSGGGRVDQERATADSHGEISLEWTLGPEPGTQYLALRAGFRHTSHVLAGARDETGRVPFRIHFRFLTPVTDPVRAVFEAAGARWEKILLAKLSPVLVRVEGGICGANQPILNEVVDDLLILVTLESLGAGQGVGALSNPCFLRAEGFLPVVGQLRLEVDDLHALLAADILEPLVTHEISHVLGFGSLWPMLALLEAPSLPDARGADTHFTGAQAVTAFGQVGGGGYAGARVPVENDLGGEGTRDRHWRSSVFGHELLTGFLQVGAANPLSRVTLASLADLGYRVELELADPYQLPGTAGAVAAGVRGERVECGIQIRELAPYRHGVRRPSLLVLDPAGTVVRTLPAPGLRP